MSNSQIRTLNYFILHVDLQVARGNRDQQGKDCGGNKSSAPSSYSYMYDRTYTSMYIVYLLPVLHRWRLIHIRALNVLSYLNTCDKKKEKVVCICWHCTPRLFLYIFGNDFFTNKISNVFLRDQA